MKAETIEALPSLAAAATDKAGVEGVKSVIGRRLVRYPQTDLQDWEWDPWWDDYYAVCVDIPMSALEAGMLSWLGDPKSKFMPQPGELRHRAMTVINKAALAYSRARKVAEHQESVHADPVKIDMPNLKPINDPQCRQAIKAMFQDFSARITREPNSPKLPPVTGPLDKHGVSFEMRASIARRQEI